MVRIEIKNIYFKYQNQKLKFIQDKNKNNQSQSGTFNSDEAYFKNNIIA